MFCTFEHYLRKEVAFCRMESQLRAIEMFDWIWLTLCSMEIPFLPDPPRTQRGWMDRTNFCCLGLFFLHCCLISWILPCFPENNNDSVQKQGDRTLGTKSAVGCWMPMSSWYLVCLYPSPGICRMDPEVPIRQPWELTWQTVIISVLWSLSSSVCFLIKRVWEFVCAFPHSMQF